MWISEGVVGAGAWVMEERGRQCGKKDQDSGGSGNGKLPVDTGQFSKQETTPRRKTQHLVSQSQEYAVPGQQKLFKAPQIWPCLKGELSLKVSCCSTFSVVLRERENSLNVVTAFSSAACQWEAGLYHAFVSLSSPVVQVELLQAVSSDTFACLSSGLG